MKVPTWFKARKRFFFTSLLVIVTIVFSSVVAVFISNVVIGSAGQPSELPSLGQELSTISATCLFAYPDNPQPKVDETFYINASFACPALSPPSGQDVQGSPTPPRPGSTQTPAPPINFVEIGNGQVKADLLGPQSVQIDPIYDAQQPLLPGRKNVWLWRVRVAQSGRAQLMVAVRSYDTAGKTLETENRPIPVEIYAKESLGHKVSRWWQGLLVLAKELNALIAGLSATIGTIGGLLIGKRSAKKPADEKAADEKAADEKTGEKAAVGEESSETPT